MLYPIPKQYFSWQDNKCDWKHGCKNSTDFHYQTDSGIYHRCKEHCKYLDLTDRGGRRLKFTNEEWREYVEAEAGKDGPEPEEAVFRISFWRTYVERFIKDGSKT